MRIEKNIQTRAVRRPRPQIVERRLERYVADDARQSPRQISRVLVRKEPGGNGRRAAQSHRRYAMQILIQLVEGAEYREQLRRGLLADSGYAGNIVHTIAGERQEIRNQLRWGAETRTDIVVVIAHVAAVVPKYVAIADELR